ncbi:H-NS family nucleoid-associated regulatory protein [Gallibacterium trehalosifermentans]|uniref:DNA-binding protein n=1 Tax=Gallibacterium trehalosifermentans TaxID=516935 RepID=A0ABV6GYN0_9PAST
MEELLKTLNNIRSLRVLAKEISLEQLETIFKKFELVVQERRLEEEAQQQELAAHKEKIEKYKELLKSEGISPEELFEVMNFHRFNPSQHKRRPPRPAKYRYIDSDGSEKTWTGQGRTPKAIQMQLDKGVSLESFEI